MDDDDFVLERLNTGDYWVVAQLVAPSGGTIGAKPKIYSEAIELVCGGSPICCVLLERNAQHRGK